MDFPMSPPAPIHILSLNKAKHNSLHKAKHKKASLPKRPKPITLMNCERAARHRRTALSQFGGRGGTGPPTKKTRRQAWGDWSPHKKNKKILQ